MACRVASILAVLVVPLVVACADDALPGCDPDVTCVADTSTGASADDDVGTSVGDDDDAGTTAGDDDDAGTTTADGGSSSDGGVDGSSDGSDGESGSTTGTTDDAEYRAVAIPGGLDRIRISKRHTSEDLCAWIVLVFPAGAPGAFDVATPEDWAVEGVAISDSARACDSDNPDMFGAEAATDASGAIEFGEPGVVYPCLVTVDVEAAFAGMLPGVPPTDTFAATDIPVEGC
jgi:hypothetical protein